MEETDWKQGDADGFSALNSSQHSALSPLTFQLLVGICASCSIFGKLAFLPVCPGPAGSRHQSRGMSLHVNEFGCALAEILLLISCTGGFPNSRVYSRLNCEELSYPTRRLTVPTSFRSRRRRIRASWRRRSF